MKYSKLFGKTIKETPKDEVATNAKLLLRSGFIDKLMAGSYTLMPLGFKVAEKIKQIVREEMNKAGAQELLMPLLHPKTIWNETGRWDSAREIMYQFKKEEKEYALSFTHEEIVLDIVRKHAKSYRDFPVKVYHFSTKFRDEPRAKSGILRGREFIMKDLYSLHTSKKDLDSYYFAVADAYKKTFKRMGLTVKMAEAAGGVFTPEHTHEFQLLSDAGEDKIYFCGNCEFSQNDEIATVKAGGRCPECKKEVIQEAKSIEVGNIFRFGTSYSEKMGASYTDEDGKKQFAYLGSYGIGITRLIGAIVEVSHDDRGTIWPESVAPFQVHLIGITNNARPASLGEAGELGIMEKVETMYKTLIKHNIEVLWDDRDVSPGEKFADADLIGIPVRLVISVKTGTKVEWKSRASKDAELVTKDEAFKRLKKF